VSDDDLARWRATAAAFASASSHESFGLAVAEALAGGIPTVASDISAHRDVFTMAGVVGASTRLVPAVPVAVATALRAALDGPRQHVAPHALPGWDDVARRTLALYDAVVTT
jgi:glycosyltransferase involved in cell wall biosynthesis